MSGRIWMSQLATPWTAQQTQHSQPTCGISKKSSKGTTQLLLVMHPPTHWAKGVDGGGGGGGLMQRRGINSQGFIQWGGGDSCRDGALIARVLSSGGGLMQRRGIISQGLSSGGWGWGEASPPNVPASPPRKDFFLNRYCQTQKWIFI